MSAPQPNRCVRFAAFEVDLLTGELRKQGIKIKLQGQPFQVLAMLLATPGEVVTREELRARLWTGETFVDFDMALNTAVKRLRDALGDTAESPRYVETLPRKGYRFICPVSNGDVRAPLTSATETKAAASEQTSGLRGFYRHAKVVVPVLLALIAALLAGFRYIGPHPALTDKDVIVLADFDNRTGEPVFDNTLRTALAIDLEQSPFLSVMPDLRMGEVLRQMERAPGNHVTPEIGREVCLRTSSKALLAGSLTSIGSHYALQLKATDCQTGKNLAAATAEAESREKVLQSLGQATASLRSKLGESLASVQKYDKPLEEATTSSLEALQAFSEGYRIFGQKGPVDAIPFFRRAVELDPKFGYAYTSLGTMEANVGEFSVGLENLRRGFELRDHLSAKERYMAAYNYYDLTGQFEKARQQIELAAREYPRDFHVRIQLGQHYRFSGQYGQAAAEEREAVRLQPDNFLGYTTLSLSYINLERLDEAQAVLREASSHNLDRWLLHQQQYFIDFLRSDAAAMQHELNWAMGKPLAEASALFNESITQAYYGRLTKARKLNRAAVASALRDGHKEVAAHIKTTDAIIDAALGNSVRGHQTAMAALALARDNETRQYAASALAVSGDPGGALRLLEALRANGHSAEDHELQEIRAQAEFTRGHAKRALAILESVKSFDLRPDMGAVFLRGRAYLAAGDGAAAGIEFQKILDHRGLVLNHVTGALAHLYFGRARVLEARSLQGQAAEDARTKALAAYQDFLTLWKDADADIPILRQAKAERAKLQ
jgi:eukaryotic-like serine/threonine-protein kinase